MSLFNKAKITQEDIDGRLEDGIFIPFKYNPITVAKGHLVSFYFYAYRRYTNKKYTHVMYQNMEFNNVSPRYSIRKGLGYMKEIEIKDLQYKHNNLSGEKLIDSLLEDDLKNR